MYNQRLTTLILITIFIISVNCFVIDHPAQSKKAKVGDEFKAISVTDPMVLDDIQFVINQINSASSSKYLVKSVKIREAYILMKEYVRLTFDLATTTCLKDSKAALDKCAIDQKQVILIT